MKCIICDSKLQGNQRKYCSNACKQKGHYINSNGYDTQMKRGYRRKLDAINSLGGGCKMCGYNKNISALEFHHKDEITKTLALDIRAFSNNNLVKLQQEIEKCVLLCANCHRKHHNPETTIEKINLFLDS